jgi:hypothetical protein
MMMMMAMLVVGDNGDDKALATNMYYLVYMYLYTL